MKIIGYSVGLIALYLVLSNATAGGKLLTAGGTTYGGLVKTFQGR